MDTYGFTFIVLCLFWCILWKNITSTRSPWFYSYWCEEPTHWKRPCFWERLRAEGEGSNRGWDGWTTSLTQWTWVSENSRRWWRTGRPGMCSLWGRRESDMSEQQQHCWWGRVECMEFQKRSGAVHPNFSLLTLNSVYHLTHLLKFIYFEIFSH